MPLTIKQFRAIDPEQWVKVYEYQGKVNRFKVFACDEVPGLTITHDERARGGARYTTITYVVHGRRTDSPSQAVRYYNEAERQGSGDARGRAETPEGKQGPVRRR